MFIFREYRTNRENRRIVVITTSGKMIKSSDLKEISNKIKKGNADKREESIYNYYVACWGI